ncbi:hypothetical protein [Streptomyces zaomyceticus]|uniref:hypothetical protein n=1 Tax=Streptomyces zaomyceticus TaxID=68286 RepID=UPI001678964A|nr:hypothetical protein [Streptomyces zaomyceticus]GHG41931.1 hypothetical protein GCM10018791_70360 [Streptomyces zaomyceticus]
MTPEMKYVAMIYGNPANRDLFTAEEWLEVLAMQEARNEMSRAGGEPPEAHGLEDAAGHCSADQGTV